MLIGIAASNMRTASIANNTIEVFLFFIIVLPFLDFFGVCNLYKLAWGENIFDVAGKVNFAFRIELIFIFR